MVVNVMTRMRMRVSVNLRVCDAGIMSFGRSAYAGTIVGFARW